MPYPLYTHAPDAGSASNEKSGVLRAPWPKMGYWKSAHGPTFPPVQDVLYVSTVLGPPPEPPQQDSEEYFSVVGLRRMEVPPAEITHGLVLG
jgi:hypothetical protein